MRLYSVKGGGEARFVVGRGAVVGAAWRHGPAGTLDQLITASKDGAVRVWSLDSGQQIGPVIPGLQPGLVGDLTE